MPSFTLSELLSPRPEEPLWTLLRQCGVDHVVALLRNGEQDRRMFSSVGGGRGPLDGDDVPWSYESLGRDAQVFADHGFTVVAIEDTPPLDAARLGLPGRDEQIANVHEQIRAMGRLGIGVLCFNWMAISSWARTDVAIPTRAGALVTGFDESVSTTLLPLAEPGEITEDQLWDALEYFLRAVVPVAEEAGVRLAMHPDDPPIPVNRNVPRIMSSLDGFRRLLELVPSPCNGVTVCQGNFALMTDDLPAWIRELGARDAIKFVHFRDVRGRASSFVETFHDDGQTDLGACMRAYQEAGFTGPLRPDHVPTMAGERNDRPGYETLGRLFATGYIRGLEHATIGASV